MVALQLRLSDEIHEEINRISEELGVSKNAAILLLMRLGKKLYDADVQITAAVRPEGR